MAQTLRTQFHSNLADSIVREIQLLKANYFYFLGRVRPWANVADVPTANTETTTFDNDLETRNDILYTHKITPNDVSVVTKRYDWVSGIVFARWDSSTVMNGKNFYVLTSANRVYKCLDNNGGAASTVEPTGTNFNPVVTADGYLWKYMYSIPDFKTYKFVSPQYIPVQRAVSASFTNKGSIEDIIVINGGAGYVSPTITVVGDGIPTTYTAVVSGGAITDVIVDPGSSGYSWGDVKISDPTATITTPAQLSIKIGLNDIVSDQGTVEQLAVPGAIYAMNITNPGTGYSSLTPPNIVIVGDGTGAAATCTVVDGSVTKVTMTSYGTGYTYATVTFDNPGGSFVRAQAEIIKNPYNGHGFDAVSELYGDTLAVSSVLVNGRELSTDTLSGVNYRQYGILKNPTEIVTGKLATTESELNCYVTNFFSTSGLTVNDVLVNNGHRFLVVKVLANKVWLQSLSSKNEAPLGTMVSETTAVTYVSSEIVTAPLVNKYSGSLLLTSNETKFAFGAQQQIALKTYVKL